MSADIVTLIVEDDVVSPTRRVVIHWVAKDFHVEVPMGVTIGEATQVLKGVLIKALDEVCENGWKIDKGEI